ncbi:bestrophin, RFP-TM, chloride channel domain-containing protein [Ditylenchus destructor]|nr:bestrophin, RFP-TM, chloride channel domain-containing protein [Ditylenchus destructor]
MPCPDPPAGRVMISFMWDRPSEEGRWGKDIRVIGDILQYGHRCTHSTHLHEQPRIVANAVGIVIIIIISAVCFATFIRGSDEETRIMRRTLIRFMVLTQALVLRDISMQVRKRFPTLDTLVAAGLLTKSELHELDKIIDPYSRYWAPIQWCYSLLYDARLHGKIASDHLLEKITDEIQHFRHGLASLLKYDWVPIPLLYPQIIFFSVRLYFGLCLIGRQFIIDMWIPIVTMIQFTVYVGWMKVAEALLNPLGEDDDDLECNYVIDKNLITGMTLVDQGGKKSPELVKDSFWNNDHIAPLYSLESAKRTVHPLQGSASGVK